MTRRELWIAVGVALLTVAAFEGVARCGYVTIDDQSYISRNAIVRAGLSWQGLRWAATTFTATNWHPLTWLSLMLDRTLFGPGALGPHLTSLAFHVAGAVVFFLGLARVTSRPWTSALAAALFAVHPLRVESVAWLSERKDVLCTFFYLLTLVAWGRFTRGSRGGYGWALGFMALALLAKPMAVTLPLALLVLDFWPLGRPLDRVRIVEKLPFAALALASCVITLIAQLTMGASEPWMRPPFVIRLAFAPVACLQYLELFAWPSGLAVLYPHPGQSLGMGEVALAVLVLAAASALAIRERARRPWLLAGWSWFLLTLVPVLGLVHVGFHGIADRYTYVPSLGLSVIAAFALAELGDRLRVAAAARVTVSAAWIGALAFMTHRQVTFWHDGWTLYARALDVTRDNFVIHDFLASDLADAGRRAEAYAQVRESIRIRPDFPHARYALGVLYEEDHRDSEAMDEYRQAIRANPDFIQAHFNLANLLGVSGQLDEAAREYRRVLQLDPNHAGAKQGLAVAERLQQQREGR
ncbi:MAG TPA: tetratricopeptide repeat protein [Myxococcota bacterium]|nr:tetratricopeptide repeat protein [Myxococcota bacterium]